MDKKQKKEYDKQYYIDNKEKKDRQVKKWGKNNPEKKKEYYRKWQKANPEKVNIKNKQWRKDNPEKAKKCIKQWCEKNPEKAKENQCRCRKNKYKTSLKHKLGYLTSSAISTSLKRNKAGRHWETLVGYTLDDLIERLESTMPEKYSWQDYLEGKLHVDHIIPKSVFNYTNPEHIDFRRCWALENLQLLPAKENLSKNNKITKPFQPALAF